MNILTPYNKTRLKKKINEKKTKQMLIIENHPNSSCFKIINLDKKMESVKDLHQF